MPRPPGTVTGTHIISWRTRGSDPLAQGRRPGRRRPRRLWLRHPPGVEVTATRPGRARGGKGRIHLHQQWDRAERRRTVDAAVRPRSREPARGHARTLTSFPPENTHAEHGQNKLLKRKEVGAWPREAGARSRARSRPAGLGNRRDSGTRALRGPAACAPGLLRPPVPGDAGQGRIPEKTFCAFWYFS